MAALKENGCHLMIASQELRDDFEIVKFAVQQSGYALRHASDKLRENKEIAMEAVRSNGNSLSLAGSSLKNNREIVMQAVKKDGMALGWASEELRNDLEIVTIAVQQENRAFQYASEELRNLKELALLAVEKRSDMYGYASKQLQNDRDVVFKCFSKSLDTLYRASEIFKNDREFILMISKIDGYQALQFASNELRNDKEIVMQAVQQNARAICFASQELKCDSDILKLIPEKNNLVEQFLNKHWTLPERFKFDRQVALDSIIYNLDNFNRAASELTSDKKFILEIVRNRGMALSVLDDQFKQDREIVLAAVTQNGEAIIHVPAHFWDDVEIIQQASKSWNQQQFNTFLKSITKLRTDKQFSIQLVQNNWRFFNGLSRKFQLDREIVLAALQSSPSHIFGNCLAPKFKTRDRALALRIVKLDGKILGLMCHRLRKDREIVSFAVQQNKDALQYAAIELRNDEKILELVSFQ